MIETINPLVRKVAETLSPGGPALVLVGASHSGKTSQLRAIQSFLGTGEIVDLELESMPSISRIEQVIKPVSQYILLDEPFLGLQLEDRLPAIDMVASRIRRQKKSMVLATQNPVVLTKLPGDPIILILTGSAFGYQVLPMGCFLESHVESAGSAWDKIYMRLAAHRFSRLGKPFSTASDSQF